MDNSVAFIDFGGIVGLKIEAWQCKMYFAQVGKNGKKKVLRAFEPFGTNWLRNLKIVGWSNLNLIHAFLLESK